MREFVRDSQRLLQARIRRRLLRSSSLLLGGSRRSLSALDQGSMPSSGGSKRSWVLCPTGVGEKSL